METFWTLGIVIIAVTQLVAFLVILAIARELGIVLVRLGPARALPTAEGPNAGEAVDALELHDLGGGVHYVTASKGNKLLVFVSPTCPACAELLPGLRTLASDYRHTGLKVLAISSGDRTNQDFAYAKELEPLIPYVCQRDLHDKLIIHGTPYAILLDHDNRVISKGVVNHLQHLESLLSLEIYSLGEPHEHSADEEHSTAVPIAIGD